MFSLSIVNYQYVWVVPRVLFKNSKNSRRTLKIQKNDKLNPFMLPLPIREINTGTYQKLQKLETFCHIIKHCL